MDFLTAGLPLFRVFRIQVVMSWLFVIYAGFEIVNSSNPGMSALGMFLLFGIVLLHEFGHCLACRAVHGDANHILLWPLGGLAFCRPPNHRFAFLVTTAGGPLVNVILIPVLYGLGLAVVTFPVPPMAIEMVFWMASLNWMLLIFNLLPIYPMDGGRLLQEILCYIVGYPRSLMIAGMVGTVGGAGLVILGMGLTSITMPFVGRLGGATSPVLMGIGLMGVVYSFGIYQQSQTIAGWKKR